MSSAPRSVGISLSDILLSDSEEQQAERLRSLRPKPWIVNQQARTVSTSTHKAKHPDGEDVEDKDTLKEPFVFNSRVFSRVADEKGAQQPLLAQLDKDKKGLRVHSDLIKLIELDDSQDERMALSLTDPPMLSVCISVTYEKQKPGEKGGVTRVGSFKGVTLSDMPQGLRMLSMMVMMSGEDYGGVKEIVVTEGGVIWVTAEEKAKVEEEGEVKIPKENKDCSDGWLGLTEASKKLNPGA